jgi:DNA-binding MarR family transcriptional regulator
MGEDGFRFTREQILLRLLLRINRAMTIETVNRLRAQGHPDVQPSFPGLLGNLDTEGTRIGALARRMGTSRQAVSQLASEIEAAGLIERRPDPSDRRGVIIGFTKKGRQTLRAAVSVMSEIESEYAGIVGEESIERLKLTLQVLLARIDKSSELGLD